MADRIHDSQSGLGEIGGFASVIPERWCPSCERFRYLSCFDDPAGEGPCNRCIREGKKPSTHERLHERLSDSVPSLKKKVDNQAQQIVWLSDQNRSLKQNYAEVRKKLKDQKDRLQVEADNEGAACAALKKELAARERELAEERVSALRNRVEADAKRVQLEAKLKGVEALLADANLSRVAPLCTWFDFGGSDE